MTLRISANKATAQMPTQTLLPVYILDTRGSKELDVRSDLQAVAYLQTVAPTFSVVVFSDFDVFAQCRSLGWPVECIMAAGERVESMGPKRSAAYAETRERRVRLTYNDARFVATGRPNLSAFDFIARSQGVAYPGLLNYAHASFASQGATTGNSVQPTSKRIGSKISQIRDIPVAGCYVLVETEQSEEGISSFLMREISTTDLRLTEIAWIEHADDANARSMVRTRGDHLARNAYALRLNIMSHKVASAAPRSVGVFDITATVGEDGRFVADGRIFRTLSELFAHAARFLGEH